MAGTRIRFSALLIVGLCLFLQPPTHAARTFFWTMESDRPDEFPAGTDSTPTYSDSTVRASFPFAYSGAYCLEVANGTYNSATFDNPTANHIWASPAEGTIRVKFRFLGTIAYMLFQITGKDRSGVDDSNDAIQFRYNGGNDWRIRYFWTGTGNTTVSLTAPADTGVWHTAQIRWRASQAPYFSASIDTVETFSSATFGAVDCAAWHHLLIGNDLNTDPDGLWFDDFEVYNEWLGSTPTGLAEATPAETLPVAVTVAPQSVRQQAEFRLHQPLSGILTIHDRTGQPVRALTVARDMTNVFWDGRDRQGAPLRPGVYFYYLSGGSRMAAGRLVVTE